MHRFHLCMCSVWPWEKCGLEGFAHFRCIRIKSSSTSKCCWRMFLHSCVKVYEFLEEIVVYQKKMETCTLLRNKNFRKNNKVPFPSISQAEMKALIVHLVQPSLQTHRVFTFFQVHMNAGRTEIIQCKRWRIVEPIVF